MVPLNIQLVSHLEVEIPTVIRYLEKKYVEDFFRTGRLQLTTYGQCQKHECNIRQDPHEGKAKFDLELDSVGMSGGGIQTVGWQSYMLCASLRESQKLSERFNVDSYFRITNILEFANAISRRVPGFLYCKIGSCMYRDEDIFGKPLSFKEAPPNMNGPVDPHGNMFVPVEFNMSTEPYFIKNDSFAVESEFRLIWGVPYEVKGPIIVECPEAIQFCEPDKPVSNACKPHKLSDVRGAILMGSNIKDTPTA